MTEIIPGLSAVADRYDLLICDVWGVIHNGRESFPEPCEALARFQRERGPVVLLSNAPRPAEAVQPQLFQLGVPKEAWAGFVTSGDATRALLAAYAPGPVFPIGPERDISLYDDLAMAFAPSIDEAGLISCTGLFDDESETGEDYRAMLAGPAARGVPFVCANPDRVVHRGEKLIPCAGAVADVYADLGGQVKMAGKPYSAVYDLALTEAERLAGRKVDRDRVLCIGDGVPTDVAGANAQGLDCLFVSGGIHADEADPAGFLASQSAHAAYSLPSLRW